MKNDAFIDKFKGYDNVVGLRLDHVISKINGENLNHNKLFNEQHIYF